MTHHYRPASEHWPYTIIVDDNTPPGEPPLFPRHGFAAFVKQNETGEIENVIEYVQEQDSNQPELTAATNRRRGWETGLAPVFDFIETVRDEWYEATVDNPMELPIRVVTTNNPADDTYAIYFRDNEGGEYLMWTGDEFLLADNEPNSELIQKALTAFADAYETPTEFLDQWRHRRTQIE